MVRHLLVSRFSQRIGHARTAIRKNALHAVPPTAICTQSVEAPAHTHKHEHAPARIGLHQPAEAQPPERGQARLRFRSARPPTAPTMYSTRRSRASSLTTTRSSDCCRQRARNCRERAAKPIRECVQISWERFESGA
eukprot:987395-Pleurochrysis_carterae.AAC.4